MESKIIEQKIPQKDCFFYKKLAKTSTKASSTKKMIAELQINFDLDYFLCCIRKNNQ